MRLHILRPVMPVAPKALKMKPPTIAPTTPSAISRNIPSPDLLTILLPINPAINPRMIQAIMPMAFPFLNSQAALAGLGPDGDHPSRIGADCPRWTPKRQDDRMS